MKSQSAAASHDYDPAIEAAPLHSGARPWTVNRFSLPSFLAEIRAACGAFEWVTFAYFAWLLTLIALFHFRLAHPARLFGLHLSIAAGIAALVCAAARSENGFLRFARHWYPLPLYIFCFEELQGLVHL
ncbi:MAG: hypothetical protein ACRD4M_12990, partial [Candidatus Acidiferrales bacterium]